MLKFPRPRFDFDRLVDRLKTLKVGSHVSVSDVEASQASLIRGLVRRGLVSGKDFQTLYSGGVTHIRKLRSFGEEV